jgi:hypothetical protein
LGRFKKLFPMELKRKLVESLIFPHFDYCDNVYGGLNGELGQSLQMAQNVCVRFACNLRKFDLTDSYAQLGWLKLNQRLFCSNTKLIHLSPNTYVTFSGFSLKRDNIRLVFRTRGCLRFLFIAHWHIPTRSWHIPTRFSLITIE